MVNIISLLLLFQSLLALPVLYLLLLTVAAARAARVTRLDVQPAHVRFLILVPAHNEQHLLPDLLNSLNQQQYPSHLCQIHVVADNCNDNTADVAVASGAQVHERVNRAERGKGPALQWLLERLWAADVAHDAVVFFDADTVVAPQFLRVMAERLSHGERVIQGYYAVRDPGRTWAISLRYAALAVLHYLRPLGRMVLGGSAGLKGNGMVFSAGVLKGQRWSAHLTEDIELHMALLLQGERVTFAPDAVLWGEMPARLSDSTSQHQRWERGRLQMARRYVPVLLRSAVRALPVSPHRAFRYFDAAIELLIPPFSVQFGLTLVGFLASLLLWLVQTPLSAGYPLATINLLLSLALLAGQAVYLFSGLHFADAPVAVYRSLFYAPLLIVWKIGQYTRALWTRGNEAWIRTVRNEG